MHNDAVEPQLITNRAGLDRLAEVIRGCERIAVDTEFHTERRYRPQLMLLQIATSPQDAWLVDPLSVDPRPLGPALHDAAVMVHGGQQDVRILDEDLGAQPRKIFDTQIGAGLLGLHYPDRLSRLGAQLLGWEMDKASALSDWSARPLSRRQIRYAVADVISLFELTDAIEEQLAPLGRVELAWQASAQVAAAARAEAPDPHEWRTWPLAPRLSEAARKALTALLAWREETAQERGQPGPYVLPYGVLIDLARRRPGSVRELTENRRIHHGFVKHNGEAVIEVLRQAPGLPTQPSPPTAEQRRVAAAVQLWAQVFGAEMQIAPGLLMPEALATEIAEEGVDRFTGWRAQFRPRLKNFLDGGEGVRMMKSPQRPSLIQI